MSEEKKALPAHAMQSAEFVRRDWHCVVPADVTVEDLLRHDYWQHVATQFREHDMVTVVSEDKAWLAQLYVRWSRRLEASLSLISHTRLERAVLDEKAVEEYQVVFRGNRSKWTILRGKNVVKDGFESEGQAKAYLADYLKALAA